MALSIKDDRRSYKILLTESGQKEYRTLFCWDMDLDAGERRELSVEYDLPLSFGLRPAYNRQTLSRWGKFVKDWTIACGYWLRYNTAGGRTWRGGQSHHRTFTVHDRSFSRREAFANSEIEDLEEDIGTFWFSGATPSGYRETSDGLLWELNEPGDFIEWMNGVTTIPNHPGQLKLPPDLTRDELCAVRSLLLAAYGAVPHDLEVRELLAGQLWYRPRPDFSEAGLTPQRQAVLAEIDRLLSQP